MAQSTKREWWPRYRPVITYTVVLAFAAIGLGLILQPARFGSTPSYANLLHFAPAEAWGATYLAVAGLLLAWRLIQRQWIGVAAHTLAAILAVWWLMAFVVRYFTDDATTIVNIVSWTVYLSLVVRSSGGLDDDDRDGPGA